MSQIQSSKIRNIIFDLGGVLLNINPLLSMSEFIKISGLDQKELTKRLLSENIFKKFETGRLNDTQFRSELCRIMNIKASDSEIDRAWNILLLDFPQPRVELLKLLRKNYRVYLLSNTNSIHFEHYTREFYEKYGISMIDLFERVFVSHEIGIHKPDAGIYTHVLTNAEINASETLLIDDTIINIEAAALQGIKGIHINGMDVTSYFENGILRFDS